MMGRFAGGGRVKAAVDALDTVRDYLENSSDPDIYVAADELASKVPEASGIADRMRRIDDAMIQSGAGGDPDQFRKEWVAIFEDLEKMRTQFEPERMPQGEREGLLAQLKSELELYGEGEFTPPKTEVEPERYTDEMIEELYGPEKTP